MSRLTANYDYDLPPGRIAQDPLPRRSDARLLVADRAAETISHHHVRDLPDLLRRNDCLVCNDTRVIPAALVGTRTRTGGRWRGLFLEEYRGGAEGPLLWRVLGKTRGKLQAGESVTLVDRQARDALGVRLIEKLEDGAWLVHPVTDGGESTLALLDRVGRVPLPHYIRGGQMRQADLERYQTVFASRSGAVAAPTAGLHFTDALLSEVEMKGIGVERITLHVGPGTFRPIATTYVEEHDIHSEWAEICAATVARLQAARAAGGRIVAVGTTSVRTLETAAHDGKLTPFSGWTDLFIRPPWQFRAVDALLTNFHLPRTTLLVLAHAFGGDELIRRAYAEAIHEEYRFYSYGDAMLVF